MDDSSLNLQRGIAEIEELLQADQREWARQKAGLLVKQYPEHADAWFVAHKTVEANQRIKVLRRALSLDPDHAAAQQALQSLLQGGSAPRQASTNPLEALSPRLLAGNDLLLIEAGVVLLLIICIVVVLLATGARQRQAAAQITVTAVTTVAQAESGTLAQTPQAFDAPTATANATINGSATPAAEITATYPPVSPPPPSGAIVLPFDVLTARFSAPLTKLVAISSDATLRLYDLESHREVTVDLYGPALSLALSPDGMYAAVGHDRAISYVNLETGTLENIYQVEEVIDQIAIGANGWMYASPYGDGGESPLTAVNIQTGEVIATGHTYQLLLISMHPNSDRLYYLSGFGSSLQTLNVQGGSVERSESGQISSTCGGYWLVQNASLMVTGCGDLFTVPADRTSGMSFYGTLEDGYGLISAAEGAGRILGITEDDTHIQVWDSASLSLMATMRLPEVNYGTGESGVHAHVIYLWLENQRYRYMVLVRPSDYSSYEDPLPNALVYGDLYPANTKK